MPRAAWLAVVVLLLLFVVQAWVAAVRDSVTIDEFGNLPVGLYAWYTGDFAMDPINPPHSRMIAALPLLVRPPAFSPPAGTGRMGARLPLDGAQRGRLPVRILAGPRHDHSRWPSGSAALVVVWARRLYGWRAAVAAAFVYSFSPTMLTHGHLVTLDLSGALGFTATAFTVWRMLDGRTQRRDDRGRHARDRVVAQAARGSSGRCWSCSWSPSRAHGARRAARGLGEARVHRGRRLGRRDQRRAICFAERLRLSTRPILRRTVLSRGYERRRRGCDCRCRWRSSTASTWR
jgi:hypothetical protein